MKMKYLLLFAALMFVVVGCVQKEQINYSKTLRQLSTSLQWLNTEITTLTQRVDDIERSKNADKTLEPIPDDWETYTGNLISFRYPKGYFRACGSSGMAGDTDNIQINNFKDMKITVPGDLPGEDSYESDLNACGNYQPLLPAGKIRVDFLTLPRGESSLQKMASTYAMSDELQIINADDASPAPVLLKSENITVGPSHTPALQQIVKYGDLTLQEIIVGGTQPYLVTYNGDVSTDDIFEKILASFKLIN